MSRPRNVSKTLFLVAGAAFAVLAIGYGVVFVISLLSSQSTTDRATYSDITHVVLDVPGDIRISGTDDNEARVESRQRWSLTHPRVEQEVDGDILIIRASCGFVIGFGCDSDFRLRVPRGAAVDARSSAGDVIVTGLSGNAVVRSSAGDVEARALSGSASLESSAGDVRGDDLRSATVEAKSSAGEVELRFATAPLAVIANSSAADVFIGLPDGAEAYRVRADSSAGDVTTNIRTDPDSSRSLTLRSSAGDVIVTYGK